MEDKIYDFIKKEHLIEEGDHLVVGVSGGADSMCLLYVLWRLKEKYNLQMTAVHIHHGLREAADEERLMVENWCQKLKIPFRFFKKNIKQEAELRKVSEEEAGRMVRYECFYHVLQDIKKGKIAVAHHMNDQAETMLLHLMRGAGLTGLKGIPVKRQAIIRPLLCVKREEIEKYLEEHHIPYCQDHTNFLDVYTRNKIRLHLLPYIQKEINERAIEHMNQTALLLKEEEDFLASHTNELAEALIIPVNDRQLEIEVASFDTLHRALKKRLLREMIQRLIGHLKDINVDHIESILALSTKEVGKWVTLPHGIIAKKTYNTLSLTHKLKEVEKEITLQAYPLDIPRSYYFDPLKMEVKLKIVAYEKERMIPKKFYTKWFDYDKIKDALYLRGRKAGDFIRFKGGTKTLKDYFIDEKIPKEQRNSIPLIADGHHIIWIIGYRISETYKVTEDTKRILSVEIIDRRI